MKKLLSLILCATLLIGCVSSFALAEESAAGATKIVEDKDATYHLFVVYSGYAYWQKIYNGFKDAAEVMGVTPVFSGVAEYEVNAALTGFQQLAAQKPNGIAVTCGFADAFVEPINDAIANGVPVVTFDADSPNSNRYAFIGTDGYAAGQMAAEYIGGKMEGAGTVGLVTDVESAHMIERNEGFTSRMNELYPDVNVVLTAGSVDDQAVQDVKNMIMMNPDIKYIFATTGGGSFYAISAISELQMTDKIKIVTFDADDFTLDNIDAGLVEATVAQSPYCEGWWALMYLYFLDHADLVTPTENWLENNYPFLPKTADSGTVIVTKDNMNIFK